MGRCHSAENFENNFIAASKTESPRTKTLIEMNASNFLNFEKELFAIVNEIFDPKFVYDKKVLPSMRSMQFGGKPIEISPNRIYNCAYLPIDHIDSFPETMFLLLGGTGVGYSVQKHHVKKLPVIQKPYPKRKKRFLILKEIIQFLKTDTLNFCLSA